MDAHLADFQTHCVAPLAARACPVTAAEGLAPSDPPAGSGPGVTAWRAPGGGTLVIDAYATETCRLILPEGAAIATPSPQAGVRIGVEQANGRVALRADEAR